MARESVAVRAATPDDASDLVEIWSDPQDAYVDPVTGSDLGRDLVPMPPEVMEAGAAIARICGDPEETLLVAEIEHEVVGAVHLVRAPLTPLSTRAIVRASQLHVRPDSRRRGVATALLSAATAWAELKDSTHLFATIASSSRDTNRFLTRLGFGQVGVMRAAPVVRLRARLVGQAAGSSDTGRLIARRRTQRRLRSRAVGLSD